MTVLHIFSGDLWAGAEVMIFNLLSRLKESPTLKVLALSLNEGVLTQKLREKEIETFIIPEKEHTFLQLFLKGADLLRGRKVDLIHSHRYKENLLALLLAKRIGARGLLSTIHGLPEPRLYARSRSDLFNVKQKVNGFLLRFFFTHVAAVSKEIAGILKEEYRFAPDNVSVIYNGIPFPSRPGDGPIAPGGYLHIGSVGRMVPVKDFNFFLDIAAEVRRHTDRVRFSILGDGPLREMLIKKTKDLKIEEFVSFLASRPDPYPYYHSIDLYLNTSLHEGIPLSVLEAMACGKPVVAPKVGGLPEVVEEGCGFLVEGRKVEPFVQACLRLIDDENMRRRMGQRAADRVGAQFNSSAMSEAYQNTYWQLCKKSSF